MSDRSQGETALVQFSERLTNSAAFGTLFREGMDLVEETAAYLDGAGRAEAKALDRSVSLTYATESMRLTTRLMQLASWLLLHRAVKEGEMTLTQANREKTKVKLGAADPGRVRLGIDIEIELVAFLAPGGTRPVFGAIGHHDRNHMIIRVNIGFHGRSFGACACVWMAVVTDLGRSITRQAP